MNSDLVIAALFFAGLLFVLAKSRWNYQRLPELPETLEQEDLELTVIIPARDEACNIAAAVKSFGGAHVIVVNDHSSDGTAQAARAAGAGVIDAPPLAPGAMGKPNACLAGARAAGSRWILFVDADTRYHKTFATSLVRYAEREGLDMASVFLKQECITMFERMLLPYAFALYFCGVNGRRVNDPHSREALANGQCLLFRRAAYDSIGGHAAVIESVIEDVALARVAKQRGLRTRVMRSERLGRVRMYDGFGAIWRGFEKNSFRFLRVNPWPGAQVIAASVLLTSLAPMALWLGWRGHAAAILGLLLTLCSLLAPWYGAASRVVLAPAAIYVFQLVVLNAMLANLLGLKAHWKGRRV